MTGEQAFETVLTGFTLPWEGMEYEDDPLDPGGATKMGITESEYNAFLGVRGRSVRELDLATATKIYRANYWHAAHCDDIAAVSPVAAMVVFDTAVNLGPGRAIRWLQAAVGVGVDGVFGPKTLAAVKAADAMTIVRRVVSDRLAFRRYRVSAEPSQNHFLQGWLNRDNDLADFCKERAHVH